MSASSGLLGFMIRTWQHCMSIAGMSGANILCQNDCTALLNKQIMSGLPPASRQAVPCA